MTKQKTAQRKPERVATPPLHYASLAPSTLRFAPQPSGRASQTDHDFGELSLLAPETTVQAKQTVNTPGDTYEREADAVAERVVGQSESDAEPSPEMSAETHATEAQGGQSSPSGAGVLRKPVAGPITSLVQREAAAGEAPAAEESSVAEGLETEASEDSTPVQRQEANPGSAGETSTQADVSGVVTSGLSGGGRPLDSAARSFMEPRFGHDFSSVRVHTDTRASQSTKAVAARAYTTGSNIAFRAGEYNPGTGPGKQLLAHELTHVIQQGATATGKVSRSEETATRVSGHRATTLLERPSPPAQRKPSTHIAPVPEAHRALLTPSPRKAASSPPLGVRHTALPEALSPATSADGAGSSATAETVTAPEQAAPTEHEAQAEGRVPAGKMLVSGGIPPGESASGNGTGGVPPGAPDTGQDSRAAESGPTTPQAKNGRAGMDAKGNGASAAGSGGGPTVSGHTGGTADGKHQDAAGTGHAPQAPHAGAGRGTGGTQALSAAGDGAAGHGGPPAPKSPREDPGFQAVVTDAKGVATQEQAHAPASAKSADAQAAASGPPNQVSSAAGAAQIGKMDQQQPKPFDRAAFVAAIKAKVADIAPKNLDEADKFKDSNKLGSIKSELSGKVSQGEDQASAGVKEKAKEAPSTDGIQPKPVTPLSPEPGGPPPTLNAAAAAPKPKTEAETSLEAGSQQIDEKMSSAHVTDEQLQKSHEPKFESALDAKSKAKSDATQAPPAFQHQEQGIVGQAKTEAQATTDTHLVDLHGVRGDHMKQVTGQQGETKAKDEQKRAEIATHVEGVYQKTKEAVEKRLARLDTDVDKAFTQGADAAKQAFEDYCEKRMDAYKDERYSGVSGKLSWVEDKFTGLPDEVNQFYVEGRNLYITQMNAMLDGIAAIVDTGLAEAKAEIARGEQEIKEYVGKLPQSLRQIGQEAAQSIQDKFAELSRSVDEKKDALIDSLSQKYTARLQEVDERIDAMKASNKGLVDAALDAVAGVIQTILEMKAMLTNVLSQAADAVGKIIDDPIGFLDNLGGSVKLGFNNFVGNIGTHLKNGLVEWLVGSLADAGIQLPETFDLKGIFTLAMEVLGLTYPAIRARAVGILGEKTVSRMEKVEGALMKLATEGIASIWAMISEKLSDLKSLILDPIESFVKEKIVVAGVMWIISLLNPASAFVKACKAIYDIVMFFVERGSQIVALIQAITGSINAIAAGAIGGAAAFIEQALAKAVPVVIGFLASLLGLGGISEKIQAVIAKVRAPIEKAIDWLITEAYNLVKSAINLFTGDGKEGKEDDKKDDQKEGAPDPEHDQKVHVGLAQLHEEEARHARNGAITHEAALGVASKVKTDNTIFKSVSVIDKGDKWDYVYVASPPQEEEGLKKAEGDGKGLSDRITQLQTSCVGIEGRINAVEDKNPNKILWKQQISSIKGDLKALRDLSTDHSSSDMATLVPDVDAAEKRIESLDKEVPAEAAKDSQPKKKVWKHGSITILNRQNIGTHQVEVHVDERGPHIHLDRGSRNEAYINLRDSTADQGRVNSLRD